MIRRFFKDSAIYSISNFIQKGMAIFLVPIFTRIFSPSDYGIIDIVSIITTLVLIIITLQVTQAIARFYPDTPDPDEKRKMASTTLWFTLIVFTAFLLVAAAFTGPLSGWVFGVPGHEYAFVVALISIFTAGLFNFLQNQLRWQLLSKQFSIVAIVTTTLTILLKILFIVVLRLGIVGVFYALIGGNVVGGVMSYCYVRHNYKFIFDWRTLKMLLNYSMPLVISSVGVYLAVYFDRIAIKEMLSLHEVGLYGIGFRVASAATLFTAGITGALTPLIFTHYREPDTPARIARLFRYFVAGALVVLLGLSIYAREIVILFTTRAYYGGYVVVPFLVLSDLLYVLYIFAPGLNIAKKTRQITMVNVFSALLNLGLNLLLIYVMGIMGAALATAISAGIHFLLFVLLGNRHYLIPYEWKRTAIALLVAAPFAIVGVMIPGTAFWVYLVKAGLIIAGSLAVGLLLLDMEEIKKGWYFLRGWAARRKLAA